ncbi:hypothetical protein CBR_g31433 [Chara braunii]|uniref:Uncharacterized protein n=1 Tax=Chara braunii TaxID=69332 RepID=A0A388LF41_CHABU|nr:hypothetical protein CBR_g31433 [Chara braunii]|eukprot:GBG80877.1 hypothetical protein CBR_g31433 [Chara braunii]
MPWQWTWAVVIAEMWLLSTYIMQADAQGGSTPCAVPPSGANVSSQLGAPYIIQQQTDVEHAKNFTVQYGSNYKIVRNYGANETYVLQQCGSQAQDDMAAALNWDAASFAVKEFTVPLGGIAVDGTTSVNFLELLGLVGHIKLLGDVVSPCVHKQLQSGQASQLNSTDGGAFLKQMEPLSALLSTGALLFENFSSVASLNKSISFTDNTAEYSPLKRAEWIKYISLFFNLEQLATGVFKQIEENYNCLAKTPAPATRPVVAWASVWFDMITGAPTKYHFSASTYLQEFVKDAGGSSLVDTAKSFNASVASEVAAFHDMLKTVQILIDDTYNSGTSYSFSNFTNLYKLPENVSFPFMSTGDVWRSDKRINGYNYFTDWFEMAVAQPQVVLGDLISIINPAKATGQRTFFRNLAKGEAEAILTPETCGPPNSPVSPMILPCSTEKGASTSKGEVLRTWSLATAFLSTFATAVVIAL